MYFNNLKIKVLNIAKEECLQEESVIPIDIIKQACKILKIKVMDFSDYERLYKFEIKFDRLENKRNIKYCFENLIKLIESDI